jgi:hypothetical protein
MVTPEKGCERIIKHVLQGKRSAHGSPTSRIRGCRKEAQDEVAPGGGVEGKVWTASGTRLKPRGRITRQEIFVGRHMLYHLLRFCQWIRKISYDEH